MVKYLSNNNLKDEISSGVFLVKFGASWCGPCKAIKPHFEKASEENGHITFLDVSIEGENKNLVSEFQINSIPTFILFSDGKELGRRVGGQAHLIGELLELAQDYNL